MRTCLNKPHQSCRRPFILLALSLFLLSQTFASEKTHQLVANGQAASTIVLSPQASPAAKLAAWEVQHAIEQITGISLPIYKGTVPPEGNLILIGNSVVTEELGLDARTYSHVEYSVTVSPQKVILFGRDAAISKGKTINISAAAGKKGTHRLQLPGMYEPQGSLRAAYHFIESLGVRYYGPRAYQCIYPKQSELSANQYDIRREPSVKYTNGLCSDRGEQVGWTIQKILYDDPSSDEVLLFARRLRTGGIPWYVNHTYTHLRYRERFGKQPDPKRPELHEGYRPEFWPPEGSPSNQLCYSSEALADQVAQDAADYFDGKLANGPFSLPVEGMDTFPVVPYDVGNYCTHEKCQAQIRPYLNRKSETPGVFGNGMATDYVFEFANKVARRIAKTHPDKTISVLAYEDYFWEPAKIELEPNVVAVPCPITCDHWKEAQRRNDETAYKFWVQQNARSGSGTYLWNYYHHPGEIGAIRGHKVFPQFTPKAIHARAVQYASDGVEGIFLCGWGEGLDFYLLMKGFDNPNFELDDLLDEYFSQSFGEISGRFLRAFYAKMEQIVSDPKNYSANLNQRVFWELQGNEANLKELEQLIHKAKAALTQDPDVLQRFASWENLMQHMKAGHQEWTQTKQKLLGKPKHDSIAKDYVDPVAVYVSSGRRHYRLITGHQMIESTPGVFGTRSAKLNITNDADRPWHAGGPDGVSVTFDLGQVYLLDELRIWNYAQNRNYGLTRRGMRQVEIHVAHEGDQLSNWRLLREVQIPEGDDRKAFEASLVVNLKEEPVRYLRIRAKGERSIGNYWEEGDGGRGIQAGLGQVRMYGKPAN